MLASRRFSRPAFREKLAVIRPTVEADHPMLLSIAAGTGVFKPAEIDALAEVLTDFLITNHAHGHQAVTYDASPILGFAYFAPAAMTDRTWYLYWIAVAQQSQGQGIGKRLMAFVEDTIRRASGRQLLVETSSLAHYDPTRRFYARCGYELAASVPDYYADSDSMVVFRKRFEPFAAKG